jgi:hypothetical protein
MVIKEIYWQDKTYTSGQMINVTHDDLVILSNAGCAVEVVGRAESVERATVQPQENTARNFKKR